MAREAPPFAALRTLEAAYRLQNYTLAGEELGVTHSAVSQTVRRLETVYGLTLFVRQGGQMTPTSATGALVDAYRQAAALVEGAAARHVAAANQSVLVISAPPSTARLWLAPRLGRLRDALPGTSVELRTDSARANLETDGVDAALRFGLGDWPNLRMEPLFEDVAYPVASPSLRDRRRPSDDASIARMPLIHGAAAPWASWFEAARVPAGLRGGELVFDDEAIEIEAAAAGLGVALARPVHAHEALSAGRLVRLSNTAVTTPSSCFLVWRPDSPRIRAIRRFADWMIEECGRSGLLDAA